MLFSTHLLSLVAVISTVLASQSPNHPFKLHKRHGVEARDHAVKQVTRTEVVSRMTRSRTANRRQVSVQPYPQCSDYTRTGPVPYARWDGLDYDAADGAIFTPNVQTREACIKLCEVDARCLVSTYNKNSKGCFKTTKPGRYFLAPFDATIKGVTCESSTAVIAQYQQASCCTEYRAASPA